MHHDTSWYIMTFATWRNVWQWAYDRISIELRPSLHGTRGTCFTDVPASFCQVRRWEDRLLVETELRGTTSIWKKLLRCVDGSFFTFSTNTHFLFIFLQAMKINKAMQEDTFFQSFFHVASKALSLAGNWPLWRNTTAARWSHALSRTASFASRQFALLCQNNPKQSMKYMK